MPNFFFFHPFPLARRSLPQAMFRAGNSCSLRFVGCRLRRPLQVCRPDARRRQLQPTLQRPMPRSSSFPRPLGLRSSASSGQSRRTVLMDVSKISPGRGPFSRSFSFRKPYFFVYPEIHSKNRNPVSLLRISEDSCMVFSFYFLSSYCLFPPVVEAWALFLEKARFL